MNERKVNDMSTELDNMILDAAKGGTDCVVEVYHMGSDLRVIRHDVDPCDVVQVANMLAVNYPETSIRRVAGLALDLEYSLSVEWGWSTYHYLPAA